MTLRQYDALVKRLNIRNERLDYNTAKICASIYEVNRDRKKRPIPYKPEDFLPKKKKQEGHRDWKSQLRYVEFLNVMFRGKDLRKDNG